MRFVASAPPSGTIRDWIDTRADETPDAISHVFTDNDAVLCWHDLRESVRGIAQGLAGLGIEKGGTI
ncbi:MAG: AMP-dependent synthetase, partial [Proteobacteria bacterium]|nr:AMP-dependent synthetase [Pseudomonadota bacterium]